MYTQLRHTHAAFFVIFASFFMHSSEPIILEIDGSCVYAPHTCMLGIVTSQAKRGHAYKKKGATRWVYKDINACIYRLKAHAQTTTISVEYPKPKHIIDDPFPLLATFTNIERTPMSDILYDSTKRSTDLIHSTQIVFRHGHYVIMSKHTLTLNTAQFTRLRAATVAAQALAKKSAVQDTLPVKSCQLPTKTLTILGILTETKASASCKKNH